MTEQAWVAFAKLIAPVMKYTADYTVENVIDNVKRFDMQGWVIADEDLGAVGAIATRISTFESGLEVCTVVAAATTGDRPLRYEEWRSIIKTIEEFAKYHGCDIVRIAGRAGWAKVLPEYDTSYVCIEKRVKEMDS